MENSKLHQCPCEKATQCLMLEPCLGCETYAHWLIENSKYLITEESTIYKADAVKYFEGELL